MTKYFIDGFDLGSKPDTLRLFLAEGLAEVGFIEAALKLRKADTAATTIICFKGVNKMAAHSETIVKLISPVLLPKLKSVGIMADCEDNPSGRVDTMIICAKRFNFPDCAADLRSRGQHESGGRRVAISLSPSVSTVGRIETLILMELEEKEIMKCLVGSVDCITTANNGQRVDEKAIVQMYISAAINGSMAGIRNAFAAGIFDVESGAYSEHLSMVDFVLGAAD